MFTLKTSPLPQVPLSVVLAQKWGYKCLWTAQVPALVGCSSLFYNWGSWGQSIVVSKCFLCCHNELLGDSETHFWHVWVKFHSSVNGLHCIHLCCAQAPPRCRLGRESEKAERQTSCSWDHCLGSYPGSKYTSRAPMSTVSPWHKLSKLPLQGTSERPLPPRPTKPQQKQKACLHWTVQLSTHCLNS